MNDNNPKHKDIDDQPEVKFIREMANFMLGALKEKGLYQKDKIKNRVMFLEFDSEHKIHASCELLKEGKLVAIPPMAYSDLSPEQWWRFASVPRAFKLPVIVQKRLPGTTIVALGTKNQQGHLDPVYIGVFNMDIED
jgi:hypothetical protein